MTAFSPIGVVGAGTMGRGIVQVLAQAGYSVLLHDTRAGSVSEAMDFIFGLWERSVAKGKMTRKDADAARSRIRPAETLADLAPCTLVVEAIIEVLDVKQQLFQAIAAHVSAECVLATNTSSLSVTAIAAQVPGPERVAGMHFFNPVPLMRVVEVIGGVRTSEATLRTVTDIVRTVGHTPVQAKDSPGFLVNHAGRGFYTEALRVEQEGVADIPDIDRIMRDQAGFRMGPFELLDLTGLDISYPVMQQIYNGFWHDPRLRPAPMPAARVAAGLLGRKTGGGFYRYEGQKRIDPPEASAAPMETPPPVWIGGTDSAGAERLSELLTAAGVTCEEGDRPSDDALIFIAPLGGDCTSSAVNDGLDPRRTLAVDTVFMSAKRLTLMRNPATQHDAAKAAQALIAGTGAAVTLIKDSPGFVAQRIVATIINIACEIAQQRIATPRDIDLAVTLGLGYPEGPLAMGDRIGPATILTILENIRTATGDMRYRPSLWLKRRAVLGLSLMVPDEGEEALLG